MRERGKKLKKKMLKSKVKEEIYWIREAQHFSEYILCYTLQSDTLCNNKKINLYYKCKSRYIGYMTLFFLLLFLFRAI